uniref:Uncharacterized protein n=1 Tax=Fagus sylvatica TaxID=28930 RepID=A0A2N9HFW3_FAGSY
MQSRLAATATRSSWVFSLANNQALRRGFASAAAGRTADPAIHSGEGQENVVDADTEKQETEHKPSKETGPFAPPRTPYATSLEEVSCAGLDGTPWPEDNEQEQSDRERQVEDDKEYYKHRKASPLSEIEVADTRKPITRETDALGYGVDIEAIGWRPEQLDTAEEALRRAIEIFRQNAMRGDPDAPHSRVLREVRGEWF